MPSQNPRLGLDFNPGNARWCEDHRRLECDKQRKRGAGTCHGPAVRGKDACKKHLGIRRDRARAEGEAVITAWSAVGRAEKRIDASFAVMGMLQQSWLRAALYGDLLRRQVEKEGSHEVSIDEDDHADSSGLIGYRFGAAGKDGTIYAQSEEVRALVALEAQERDRAVKYAKTAHDMGISERLTGLAETWGDLVIGRIMLVLSGLALTPGQQEKVPELIQAHLGSIDMTATGEKPAEGHSS